MALDLIEPVRPEVEAFVLDLVARRTFRKAEFTETRDGHVRLMAPLTHELAETLPRWSRAIAPWAERVAHLIGKAMEGHYVPATPLTSSRVKAAQAVVKARKVGASQRARNVAPARQRPDDASAPPVWACPECGGAVINPRHVRCDDCIAADPAQTLEIRSRRGQAISARKRALSEWSEAHGEQPYDPELFAREILPRLAAVKLSEIMAAANCSKGSASDIRRGKWAPHVCSWAALARLVGVVATAR